MYSQQYLFFCWIALFSDHQVFLSSLQNGVSLKKLPAIHRVVSIPAVSRASALDADIHERSVYLADGGHGSLELLKLSASKTKQALTPAGNILTLKVDPEPLSLKVKTKNPPPLARSPEPEPPPPSGSRP